MPDHNRAVCGVAVELCDDVFDVPLAAPGFEECVDFVEVLFFERKGVILREGEAQAEPYWLQLLC